MRYQRVPVAAIAALTLVLLQTDAGADHRRPARRDVDVDIDSLKAELSHVRGEWLLDLQYDIEIEDYYRGDRFELIVSLTEDKYELTDRRGRRLEFVVPLDRPTKVKRDELEFENRVTLTVPERAFRNPKQLRLHAVVVYAGDDRPLKHKDRSVKYKQRRHLRRHHRASRLDVRPRVSLHFGGCRR